MVGVLGDSGDEHPTEREILRQPPLEKHSLEFLPLTDPDDIEREFPTFLNLYAKRFADYPLLTSKEYPGVSQRDGANCLRRTAG
ncbi:MAG: hypothetical protein U0231_18900 [Nitrospiraceae bacterium]